MSGQHLNIIIQFFIRNAEPIYIKQPDLNWRIETKKSIK
jgi:hypothetical protein